MYRIVVGVDGSQESLRALEWAIHEAAARDGHVQAVGVYDWFGTEAALLAGLGPEAEEARMHAVVADAVAAVTDPRVRVPVATEVLRGDPAQRLTEAAADADLLVVASRGRGHLRQAVLGSVSEGVIHHASCPVVVIPAAHAAPSHTAEVAVAAAAPTAPATAARPA